MSQFKRQLLRRHRLIMALAVLVVGVLIYYALQPRSTAEIDSYAACVEAGYPVTLTEPPVCREGKHNFVGTPNPPVPTTSPLSNVDFEVLVDGDTHSTQPGHEQHLITTPALWSSYWSKVHASLPSLPPLLPVDFTKNDVVGISLGQKMTGGYGLKVTGITTGAHGTTVSFTESTPTITCAVTQQISNRYVIIRTPKLVQPVSFRLTPEKRRCG